MMQSNLPTVRGTLLLFAICCAVYAEDVPQQLAPPFRASFDKPFTTSVAPPVAGRSKATASPLSQIASELPQVRVSTLGPESLVVNETARYAIKLENLSGSEARAINVRCNLPSWVDLSEHTATHGSLENTGSELVWSLSDLEANATRQLDLDLIPREGKAFDLQFRITAEPTNMGKHIVVRQPMLSLELDGPKSISFGDLAPWNLSVSNPGTGPIRNVQLDLFAGNAHLESQILESIPAGSEQSIAIQIDPQQVGRQSLRVVGRSNDVSDAAEADFLVRRGRLTLDLLGAARGFAGQVAPYKVVLNNTGDDAVEGILMSLDIPAGMEYQGGLPNADVTVGGVSWVVNKLEVDEKITHPISLKLQKGGLHALRLHASSVDELAANDEIVVEGITAPDLRLVVRDPIGPRSLQGTVDYEIEVSNPGTDIAKNISVIAMCDEGCEILDVSGTASIKDDRIYFKPVLELAPAHKFVLKVKVQPKVAGVLNFRVIVRSTTPETKLAMQETTLVIDQDVPARDRRAIADNITPVGDPSRLLELSYPADLQEMARPQADGSSLR